MISKSRAMPLWLALSLLAAALLVCGVVIVHLVRTRGQQAERLAGMEATNRGLQARSEKLSREVAGLRQALSEAAAPPEAGTAHPPRRTGGPSLEEEAALTQLRENLATANASISSMEARIEELEANLDKTTRENKRLAASEADLKEKVSTTARVLEAVQVELKTKSARLTQLEVTNQLLNDQNRAISDKTSRMNQLLASLEELNRRRESYLSNILRRYRDVTDQYQSLSARLENPRDNVTPPGPELSRIQSSISMAEEDLRQLTNLNAQVARVQQKIAGK